MDHDKAKRELLAAVRRVGNGREPISASAAGVEPPGMALEFQLEPIRLEVEWLPKPQVEEPGFPPIPQEILDLEGKLEALEQVIRCLREDTHPSLEGSQNALQKAEAQWQLLQAEAESQAPELPEAVKDRLGGAVQADLSDLQLLQLCSVSPATPTSALLPYLRRLRDAARARQAFEATREQYEAAKANELESLAAQTASAREELQTRQNADVDRLIDQLYKTDGFLSGPARRWSWLARKLKERRVLPEVMNQASTCYSILFSEEDERTWQQARADGTRASYERYLAASPEGQHVDEAKAAVRLFESEEKAWHAALVVRQSSIDG